MIYSLDKNDKEITEALEKLGCKVVDNAKTKRLEKGILDKFVGFPNPYGDIGIWVYVEIKYLDNDTTPEQKSEIRECRDKGLPVEVIRNIADIELMYQKYLGIMYAQEMK